MTMWYRIAQMTSAPTESPFSSLNTKDVTPEEMQFAKELIKLKSLKETSDKELERIIKSHKEAHVNIKKMAEGLKSLSKNIPFENLKPTFNQFANDTNQLAEDYLKTVIDAEVNNRQRSKDFLTQTETKLGGIPTDLDSAIKTIKKLKLKDYVYYTNLFGDLININPFFSIPIKILDYKFTWIPKFESDIEKVGTFTAIYQTTKDKDLKQQSRDEIIKGISGILGTVSNAAIDIGAVTIRIPGLQIPGGSFLALGAVLQIASTLMDPDSPLNYREISKLPGQFTDAVARVSEGLPLSESAVPEKRFTPVSKVTLEEFVKQVNDPESRPILEGLETEYKNFDKDSWKNKYGTDKTIYLVSQPLNVAMKFANDTFGEKYFWLDDPSSVYYRNFVRYFNQIKGFYRGTKNQQGKKAKTQTPSKRSIGYQLVDSAIRNNMTNQFTASLIREMANKYTAGNIYNFLNKKNIEINNLISNEARNANFAARFNVRPGSAGLDSLKVDIMNLKRILNTWK